jgi:4a-hydroxytetrahydrobiopterin dehydratase
MDSATSKLSDSQVADVIRQLPDWTLEGGALVRSLTFPGFTEAMKFVNRVAEVAERENHHPDIDIRYNRVRLALVSHDAGGITQRDSRMARLLSDIVAGSGA